MRVLVSCKKFIESTPGAKKKADVSLVTLKGEKRPVVIISAAVMQFQINTSFACQRKINDELEAKTIPL